MTGIDDVIVMSHDYRALHVGLEVAEEVDAVLYVSYVVTNASWSSAYDIRVFTKDKNMKVQYSPPFSLSLSLSLSPVPFSFSHSSNASGPVLWFDQTTNW